MIVNQIMSVKDVCLDPTQMPLNLNDDPDRDHNPDPGFF